MSLTETKGPLGLVMARLLFRNGNARAIRERAGLSQAELGNLIDPPIPPSTISAWELGTRVPHGEAATRCLERLIELDEFDRTVK